MGDILIYLKRLDWVLIITALLLVVFGLLFIYSSSLREGDFLNLQKQAIFFAIGFLGMIFLSFFNWRNFRDDPYFILIVYFLCLLSLLLLFLFAPEIRGTKSWYKLGPISIDPIEFTKIILIVLLAKYFSMRHIEMYNIKHIFLSGIYVLLPAVLVFLQPDFGSVLILIAIWFGVLIISGIKIRHFLALFLLLILIFIFSWGTILKDYQKERISSFLLPQTADPLKAGWNQTQSKIAIGSGGLLGQGVGKGSQTQYGFLPEPHTDFIFAVIAEETGFLGVGVLLSLFSVLIWRIMKIAGSVRNNFSRLFASGIIITLISQIFIHIGMNLGLLPIVGISLPLVSYGGSGLISLFLAFGILQNIKANS